MTQDTCLHCGRTLEDALEIVEGHCSSDDCPRHELIETFIANLLHAVRNHETVLIGGGEFGPAALKVIADVLSNK